MTLVVCRPLSTAQRVFRWAMFGLWGSLIVEAHFSGIRAWLPLKLCLVQRLVHFPCPTCGLTRSLLALLRGDWQQALIYHLFGPLLFIAGIGLTVQAMVELWQGQSLGFSPQEPLMATYRRVLAHPVTLGSLLSLLLAYYGLRLYARYTVGELPFALDQSAIWHGLVAGAKLL